MRIRYIVPLLMTTLFLTAFVAAELRWRGCIDSGRSCFGYPIYLPYETQQALDLSWPALVPIAILDRLPDSIASQAWRGVKSAVRTGSVPPRVTDETQMSDHHPLRIESPRQHPTHAAVAIHEIAVQ